MTDSAGDYLDIFEKLPLETLKRFAEILNRDQPDLTNPVDVMAHLILESPDEEAIQDAMWANIFAKMDGNEDEYFAFMKKLGCYGSQPFSAPN